MNKNEFKKDYCNHPLTYFLFFQKITIQDQIPMITITKDNQFDIITQTEDELLYRNEIYGFELHL